MKTSHLSSEKQDVPPDLGYESIRCIGEGSYGRVWLVRDRLGGYWACKLVYRAWFDTDRPYEREYAGIRRFESFSRDCEGQIKILEVGRHDRDGYFYYVMELADDAENRASFDVALYVPRTLKEERLRHGRLSVSKCVDIGLRLCAALQSLHENGLIHRDIKPANVVFVQGVPKLADIGLVTDLANGRSCVGTEGFMAPEGPVSPQADIFALGKVFYEIAMGRDCEDFPDLPGEIGQFSDREALLELNAVIARACQPDPRRRYESAAQMMLDLRFIQKGKSLLRARHRRTLAKRAGLLIIVPVFIGMAILLALRKKSAPDNRSASVTEVTRKYALPDPKILDAKESQILRAYDSEGGPGNVGDEVRIAKEMLNHGVQIGDPTLEMATLQCALRLATEAADVSLVRRVCGVIADRFEINSSELKLTALQATAAYSRTPESRAALAEGCLGSGFEALAEDDYLDAKAMQALACATASALTNSHLLAESEFLSSEEARCASGYAAAREYIRIHQQNPEDAEAGFQTGKFLCFVKYDWNSGLPLMSRSESEPLGKAALAEISQPPQTVEQQMKMGDRWWDLAGTLREPDAAGCLTRARYWYLKAVANSDETAKLAVRARLAPRIASVPVQTAELHIYSHVTAGDHIDIFSDEIVWRSDGKSTRNKINHVRVPDHQGKSVTRIRNCGVTRLLPDNVDFMTAKLSIDSKPQRRGRVSLDTVAEDHVTISLMDTRPSPAELDVTVLFSVP